MALILCCIGVSPRCKWKIHAIYSIDTCLLSLPPSHSLYFAAFTVLQRLKIIAWLVDAFRTGYQGNYCGPVASLWKRRDRFGVTGHGEGEGITTATDIQIRPTNMLVRLKRLEVSSCVYARKIKYLVRGAGGRKISGREFRNSTNPPFDFIRIFRFTRICLFIIIFRNIWCKIEWSLK